MEAFPFADCAKLHSRNSRTYRKLTRKSEGEAPMSYARKSAAGVVALFNASDDTIDMVQKMLTDENDQQTLIWCHFADLKKGIVDFVQYLEKHNPEVVVFDISPPYDENWAYFKKM